MKWGVSSLLFFYISVAVAEQPLQRIAFGSCAMQFKAQPIWDAIAKKQPDLFIFLGDNIYGDFDSQQAFTPTKETLKRDWGMLANEPHFKRFRSRVPIMATWDNHDYGKHNGGAEFELKELTRTAFLDFFAEPKDSQRRQTPGIYEAKIFGPAGKRVQVILLDTRYFKGPFIKDPRTKMQKKSAGLTGSMGNYLANNDPHVTLLGKKQWQWLEHQIKQPAELRVIASSTQVIANEKAMDEWGNYPHERQKLFDLINQSGEKNILLLSGNVHFTEISKIQLKNYELIDFTSSGLTHTNKTYAKASNRYRVAGAYDELNFGLLEIDWQKKDKIVLKLSARNDQGAQVFEYSFDINKH